MGKPEEVAGRQVVTLEQKIQAVLRLRAEGALSATVEGVSATWAAPPVVGLRPPAAEEPKLSPDEQAARKQAEFERTLLRSGG